MDGANKVITAKRCWF